MPSHYLNQYWNYWHTAHCVHEEQWNPNRKSCIFIQENAFENVVWQMAVICSRPHCGNSRYGRTLPDTIPSHPCGQLSRSFNLMVLYNSCGRNYVIEDGLIVSLTRHHLVNIAESFRHVTIIACHIYGTKARHCLNQCWTLIRGGVWSDLDN